MKILSCLVTAMMLGAMAMAQTEQGKAADEAANRKLLEQYAAAFNKKDAKALAQIWAEDGEYTSLSGRAAKGRSEIESLFRDILSGPYKDARIQLVAQSVRLLAPDVAMGKATWETSGVLAPDGKERPTMKTVSLSVAAKRGGQWLVVSALPMVLPASEAR